MSGLRRPLPRPTRRLEPDQRYRRRAPRRPKLSRPPDDSGARTSLRRRVLTRRCVCPTSTCRPVSVFLPRVVAHLRAGLPERHAERCSPRRSAWSLRPEKDEKFSLLRSRPQRQRQVKSFVVANFSGRTLSFEGECPPAPLVASIDDSFLFNCLNAELRSLVEKLWAGASWGGPTSAASSRARARGGEASSCVRAVL